MKPDLPLGPRRTAAVLCCVTLAACAHEVASPAQDAPAPLAEARASVDKAIATTGDVITFRVEVEHDTDIEVEIPEAGAEIAGFRIIDTGSERAKKGRRVVEARWYTLRADLVGSYVLPAISIRYRPTSRLGPTAEVEAQVLTTSEIFVQVSSVLSPEGDGADERDIRDIKPLQRVDPPLPWLALATLATAIVALAGWLLWRRMRRRAPIFVPPAPAHEVAFAALGVLRRTDFADAAAVRRYYFSISEVLRRYVEDRFALNATDLTTEEILLRLIDLHTLDADARDLLRSFLAHTDAVKFAAHTPSSAEIERTYEQALRIVELTMPRPPPEQEAA